MQVTVWGDYHFLFNSRSSSGCILAYLSYVKTSESRGWVKVSGCQ